MSRGLVQRATEDACVRRGQPADVELGKRIRTARRAANLTGPELARRVGVTHGAVSQYETGRSGVSLDVLRRIAGATGVDLAELMTGTRGAYYGQVHSETIEHLRGVPLAQWPRQMQEATPEYWPGTLREFINSPLAEMMQLVPDEVPLLARAALVTTVPTDDNDWVGLLSIVRMIAGAQGRPIVFEVMPTDDKGTQSGE